MHNGLQAGQLRWLSPGRLAGSASASAQVRSQSPASGSPLSDEPLLLPELACALAVTGVNKIFKKTKSKKQMAHQDLKLQPLLGGA